ncbi:Gp49 family protein [Alicyclobacillus sp. SO9]|uniref:Gp49 family protein n=1 Tax=Alicyclobacillus sp. SO9 TaxID=2665646 RepID=UPI0018E8CD25|nr:Gp49 family protein [Alicyclobacillus sp. SO9]QQE80921.1 hypothetical protein GI364_11350 [Alicyclobacillus sp. SO9]
MNTGDLIFTTVIQPTGNASTVGELLSEDVLRHAIEQAQGKTILVNEDFNKNAIVGVASQFKEIPGIGFTIGGRILKSEFINGARQVEEFELRDVAQSFDFKTPGYARIPEYVSSTVVAVEFAKMGRKTTVCLITIDNSFEIVGTSACVDPEKFDEETGRKWAWKDALNKLEELDGFLRRSAPRELVMPSLSPEQMEELKEALIEARREELHNNLGPAPWLVHLKDEEPDEGVKADGAAEDWESPDTSNWVDGMVSARDSHSDGDADA